MNNKTTFFEKKQINVFLYKEQEETYRIVSEAINKLPDQMKAIMQLSLEGKKNAEIADRYLAMRLAI